MASIGMPPTSTAVLQQQAPPSPSLSSLANPALSQIASGVPTRDEMKGLLDMAQSMEKALLTLAQAAPKGSKEFRMAIESLRAGVAKQLADYGEAPASGPTSTGTQFPGSSPGIAY